MDEHAGYKPALEEHMRSTIGQLLRYGIVGGIINGSAFLVYLAITAAGIDPKLVMTLLYATGFALSFIFNRRWTFRQRAEAPGAVVRYTATYAIVYVFNLGALYVFSDLLGLPHQGVMFALIIINVCVIFALQKFWVFQGKEENLC